MVSTYFSTIGFVATNKKLHKHLIISHLCFINACLFLKLYSKHLGLRNNDLG
jgi:hypothetical protein